MSEQERLSEAVSAALGTEVEIIVEGSASVGATRRTLFGQLRTGDGRSEPVVIQIAGLDLDGLEPTTEAELIAAAASVGVPVPEPLVACGRDAGFGAPFQVVRRVEGLTVPRQILRAVDETPGLGEALTRQCADALARLHSLDPSSLAPGVPSLADPSPAEAYVEHLASIAANVAPSPVVSLGMRWLRLHLPDAPDRPAVVHSDMRNGNLIVDPGHDTTGGLRAVIDWELAHLGDPMEDLAWLCLRCWRFGNDSAEVGGFGHLQQLVDSYEAAGGQFRVQAYEWWTVARTLWWCLVLRLQATAFTSGLSESLVLAASGRRVAELEHDLLVLIDPLKVS